MKKKQTAASPDVSVVFSTEVLRRVRQHARSSMSAEICGVLIGEIGDGPTLVETLIEGEAAQQGGSHVTFTQDTWAHIYQVKDAKYPDKRIVGWYHSHPGFGVFLSDHDTFIQRNFFSNTRQLAWVYDPHSDEEGCFVWKAGEIVKLGRIELRDEPPADKGPRLSDGALESDQPAGTPSALPSIGRAAVKWSLLALSYFLAVILGFAAAIVVLPRIFVESNRSSPLELPAPPPSRPDR
ncbi:MAG: Mov34/MPN/PAD-1 family protein [Bryobacteraceae bacterium]